MHPLLSPALRLQSMRKLHAKLRDPGRHFDLLPPHQNPRLLPREVG